MPNREEIGLETIKRIVTALKAGEYVNLQRMYDLDPAPTATDVSRIEPPAPPVPAGRESTS